MKKRLIKKMQSGGKTDKLDYSPADIIRYTGLGTSPIPYIPHSSRKTMKIGEYETPQEKAAGSGIDALAALSLGFLTRSKVDPKQVREVRKTAQQQLKPVLQDIISKLAEKGSNLMSSAEKQAKMMKLDKRLSEELGTIHQINKSPVKDLRERIPVSETVVESLSNKMIDLNKQQTKEDILKSAQKEGARKLISILQEVPVEKDYIFYKKVKTPDEIVKDVKKRLYKLGGVIGIDHNVIPNGKLHEEKHGLTGKISSNGIPVVFKDGGEIEQLAEIEKKELILTKKATDKVSQLRDLYKKTKDENVLIELGQYVQHELLNNTIDHTNSLLK